MISWIHFMTHTVFLQPQFWRSWDNVAITVWSESDNSAKARNQLLKQEFLLLLKYIYNLRSPISDLDNKRRSYIHE